MKKIVISLAIIGVVAGITLGITGAWWSDEATSKNASFTAGTFDLQLYDWNNKQWQNNVTQTWDADNMAPGGKVLSATLPMKNFGSVDANHMDFAVVNAEPGVGNMDYYMRITKLDYDGKTILEGGAGADLSSYKPPTNCDLYVAKDCSAIGQTFGTNCWHEIQATINEAVSGQTVCVEAGTYAENILIDEALSVVSMDGAEETIIDGSGFRYVVNIYSADVTFEGFTVTNPTYKGSSDATGILIGTYLGDPVSNVRVLNNIVKAVRNGTGGAPSMYGATGINIGKGLLSNITISGNTITDIHNPDGASVDHTCGINVWDNANGVEISNNTISNIKYNGIMLQYASDVRIEDNSITGCPVGIRVEPFGGVTVSDLTIHYNDIVGNSEYGVLNTMTDFIDATNNWWGNFTPSDQVSSYVDWDPYLNGPYVGFINGIDQNGNGFADLDDFEISGITGVKPGLAVGERKDLKMDIQLDATTPNEYQGKSVGMDMTIIMQQGPN